MIWTHPFNFMSERINNKEHVCSLIIPFVYYFELVPLILLQLTYTIIIQKGLETCWTMCTSRAERYQTVKLPGRVLFGR